MGGARRFGTPPHGARSIVKCAAGLIAWLLVALAGACTQEPTQTPGQRLALEATPAVVRVFAGWHIAFRSSKQGHPWVGTGSGFFVHPEGYVVTNAHVVDLVHMSETEAAKTIAVSVAQMWKAQGKNVSPQAVFDDLVLVRRVAEVVLPTGETRHFDIKSFGAPVSREENKDVAVLKIQVTDAPTLLLGDDASLQVQDPIYALGFPGAVENVMELPFGQLLEPTVTDGTVSAKRTGADGVPLIQVNTLISQGNSGGPALDAQGRVVGLATFGSPDKQGYNFLVPASVVSEFVRQAGASNATSETNRVFQQGLDAFRQRHYTEAIAKFEETTHLFPQHATATRLIADARAAKRAGKEALPPWWIACAAVFAGAVGVALVLFLRQRRGRAQAPAPLQAVVVKSAPALPAHGSIASRPPSVPPARASRDPVSSVPPARASRDAVSSVPPTELVAMSGAPDLAQLTARDGILRGQRFGVGPHGVMIGREPGTAQIVLADARVSGRHCWIGFEDGRLIARDTGSTNGTYLNDMARGRITCAELSDGDMLIISEPSVCTLVITRPARPLSAPASWQSYGARGE